MTAALVASMTRRCSSFTFSLSVVRAYIKQICLSRLRAESNRQSIMPKPKWSPSIPALQARTLVKKKPVVVLLTETRARLIVRAHDCVEDADSKASDSCRVLASFQRRYLRGSCVRTAKILADLDHYSRCLPRELHRRGTSTHRARPRSLVRP